MTKVKKIKKKTHKGLKKVLNVRKSGSISVAKQGKLHNTGKNCAKTSRKKKQAHELHKTDLSRIKDLI